MVTYIICITEYMNESGKSEVNGEPSSMTKWALCQDDFSYIISSDLLMGIRDAMFHWLG